MPKFAKKIEAFGNLSSFKEAVKIAASGEEVCGKKNRHLNRLWGKKKKFLKEAARKLNSLVARLNKCKNFEDLYHIIISHVCCIPHIKASYCYDTALRIGAQKGFRPREVHLPAPKVLDGAKDLKLKWQAIKSGSFEIQIIIRKSLPLELNSLEPHEIEDFLCNFDWLKKQKQ